VEIPNPESGCGCEFPEENMAQIDARPSVGHAVGASVVGASVGALVGASVGALVGASRVAGSAVPHLPTRGATRHTGSKGGACVGPSSKSIKKIVL
jgi:hypothetical protein